LSNRVLVSNEGLEAGLRQRFAASGFLRGVLSLPGGLFADNRPPQSILLVEKPSRAAPVLFADLRERGETIRLERGIVSRRLPQPEVDLVVDTYRAWRTGDGYSDVPGYCVSVDSSALSKPGSVLAPRRVDAFALPPPLAPPPGC
jgi:type I restriction enzyme M protein